MLTTNAEVEATRAMVTQSMGETQTARELHSMGSTESEKNKRYKKLQAASSSLRLRLISISELPSQNWSLSVRAPLSLFVDLGLSGRS